MKKYTVLIVPEESLAKGNDQQSFPKITATIESNGDVNQIARDVISAFSQAEAFKNWTASTFQGIVQ